MFSWTETKHNFKKGDYSNGCIHMNCITEPPCMAFPSLDGESVNVFTCLIHCLEKCHVDIGTMIIHFLAPYGENVLNRV